MFMSHQAARLLIALLMVPFGLSAFSPDRLPPVMPTVEDPRLIEVASLQRIANGIATTPDGRIFLSHPQVEGPGAQVSELKDGKPVPYPDLEISLWKPDSD